MWRAHSHSRRTVWNFNLELSTLLVLSYPTGAAELLNIPSHLQSPTDVYNGFSNLFIFIETKEDEESKLEVSDESLSEAVMAALNEPANDIQPGAAMVVVVEEKGVSVEVCILLTITLNCHLTNYFVMNWAGLEWS